MSRHRAPACQARHARRAPWQVPAILVVALDVITVALEWVEAAIESLDFERRHWDARQETATDGPVTA